MRWTETISNEDLWKITKQQPIAIQIKKRKRRWIDHTLRKPTGSIERSALVWNPQGARRRRRPKKTWKRTVEEEAMEVGKTWREVKKLLTGSDGSVSQMPYPPEGATRIR
jgi:hypothetical protein